MRFAIIENGIVVNTAEAEQEYGLSQGWVASDTAHHGDTYDGVNFTGPILSLDSAKSTKNGKINEWRENANFSSFTWGGKLIASDKLSRSDIDAVCGYIGLNNALPASFPGAWKAMDNSIIPIPDVATFKAMYQAMVDTGASNFVHSQQLKAQLASANTLAQVEAIVW